MPSIHVGWAALVSFGIVAASTSKWRWVFMAHLVLTVYAVTATGNHWWFDSIVAVALLVVVLRIDDKWLLALRTRSKSIGKISTS
jgi:hypothetical protein